jgi:hypothetical protein
MTTLRSVSLTHPHFVDIDAQTKEVVNVPVPAFPEICTRMDGVYFEGLRAKGFNRLLTDEDTSDNVDLATRYAETYLHEIFGHEALSSTLFSKVVRLNVHKIHCCILLLCQGLELIEISDNRPYSTRMMSSKVCVPFSCGSCTQDSLLIKLWSLTQQLVERNALAQEIFSIWQSMQWLDDELLKYAETNKNVLELRNKQKYEEMYPGFTRLYNQINHLRAFIDNGVILESIYNTFATSNPNSELHNVVSIFERYKPLILSLNEDDPGMEELSENIDNELRINDVNEKSDFLFFCTPEELELLKMEFEPIFGQIKFNPDVKWILALDGIALTFTFDANGCYFYFVDDLSAEQRIRILLESLRQQLWTGNGIQCPFWSEERGYCCEYRHLLEGFIENTQSMDKPDHLWSRKGCLKSIMRTCER